MEERAASPETAAPDLREQAADVVIITKGDLTGQSGGTNVMKILRVGEHILPG